MNIHSSSFFGKSYWGFTMMSWLSSSRTSTVASVDRGCMWRPSFRWWFVLAALWLGSIQTAHADLQSLHSFLPSPSGSNPFASLVQGPDGKYYGTTVDGGSAGTGTIFRIEANGSANTLVNFEGPNGSTPYGALLLAPDGYLYGTTSEGGEYGSGTVYRMTVEGVLSTLFSFDSSTGINPYAPLVLGPDGQLYGTTPNGGAAGAGTIYRMSPEGVLTTLAHFNGANGRSPFAALVVGPDGQLYGTTPQGGSSNAGTAFRVSPVGIITTLLHFNVSIGSNPFPALIVGPDGQLYGTTSNGGAGFVGTVFRMGLDGSITTLVSFQPGGAIGKNPYSALVLGADGQFYGTTFFGGTSNLGTVFRMTLDGTLTTLASFNAATGGNPYGALLPGADGVLYGPAYFHGAGNAGTIVRIDANGALTALTHFRGPEGGNPYSAPVLGPDGQYYGTTSRGGTNGLGTVYRLAPDGTPITLVSFDGANGANPYAPLTLGADGQFYGTTPNGGNSDAGTAFRLSLNGMLTTLAHFDGTNGRHPYAAMVLAPDGHLYGTTPEGGSIGAGVVYRLGSDGSLTRIVDFGGANYATPFAPLVVGPDGLLYGTTTNTGSLGTVFRVSLDGTLTTLAMLSNSLYAGLAVGSDGQFYGSTFFGGSGAGTLFRMTPDGTVTQLADFAQIQARGAYAALVSGPDGQLYGTTYFGGAHDAGTVFRLGLDGALTKLMDFDGVNGRHPFAALVLKPDGQFLGTTLDGGTGDTGTVFQFRPPSAAPQDLTASAILDDVDLSWSFVPGATQYNVYQSQVSGGQAGTAPVQTVLSTGTLISSLANGPYFFRVSAVSPDGESVLSEEASALVNVPNVFALTDRSDVPLNSTQTSDAVSISGLVGPAPILVVGGQYAVGCADGAYTTEPGTVETGDTVCVRHVSSNAFSTGVDTTLEINGISDVFSTTTVSRDITPDAFVFTDLNNVPSSTLQTSNAISVNGINAPSPISVVGGTYSVNGLPFTATPGTLMNADLVRVQHVASAGGAASTNTTLTIGADGVLAGVTDTFTSTTATTAPDTTPDPFSFAPANDVEISTVQTSSAITVSGINQPALLSISGGTVSINGAAFFRPKGKPTVKAGDVVRVQHTSSATYGTTVVTTLTLGGVTASFSSRTRLPDVVPDAFDFVDVSGVAPNAVATSAPVVISGIDAPVTISIAGGSKAAYSINGGSFVSRQGTVRVGDSVRVRTTLPRTSTAISMTVTIGGVSDAWTVRGP